MLSSGERCLMLSPGRETNTASGMLLSRKPPQRGNAGTPALVSMRRGLNLVSQAGSEPVRLESTDALKMFAGIDIVMAGIAFHIQHFVLSADGIKQRPPLLWRVDRIPLSSNDQRRAHDPCGILCRFVVQGFSHREEGDLDVHLRIPLAVFFKKCLLFRVTQHPGDTDEHLLSCALLLICLPV